MSIRRTRYGYVQGLFSPLAALLKTQQLGGPRPKKKRVKKKPHTWQYSVHDPNFSKTSGAWWNRIGQV